MVGETRCKQGLRSSFPGSNDERYSTYVAEGAFTVRVVVTPSDITDVAEAAVVIELRLRGPWGVEDGSGGFTDCCCPSRVVASLVEEGLAAGPAALASGVSLGSPDASGGGAWGVSGTPGISDWGSCGVFVTHGASDPSVPSTCTGMDVVWKDL